MKHQIFFAAVLIVISSSIHAQDRVPTGNWGHRADSSSQAFITNYWNQQDKYFNYGNGGSKLDFHYWPQAHALDLLTDAYIRTGDSQYLQIMNGWFEGVRVKNGNTFFNRYYDDMQWNAMAMLRAYRVTSDEKFLKAAVDIWEDIKTGWNEHAGGGMMWEKEDRYGKNACSNGPAAIVATLLFRAQRNQADLEWAKKIYQWERKTLFDQQTGAIWDNVKEKGDSLIFNKKWIFTYNQGTFLGSAIELFDLTNDSLYLQDAIKAADYTLRSLTVDGLLKAEGRGDGGLFKGIFVRYLSNLIQHHALPADAKKRYVDFLFHNAETLWKEGTDKSLLIYGPYWKTKPGLTSDMTVTLSGAMLIEAVANLEIKGFCPSPLSVTYPEWSGNPIFKGWYADPEAVIYGERYWIYPTFSAAYEKQVHFDCFSSYDLVNWTKHEKILDTARVKWAKRAMWAPGVIEKGGNYYLFFGANDVHEGEVGGIGVAVAKSPEGPYRDLIGKPLINDIINGAQPIDQFVFHDRDGNYYMYYGGWRHCNLVKLNKDFTGLEPFPDGSIVKEITPEGYVEGPVMFIRKGKYYFMWSEGGWTGPNYRVAYAIADGPFGPFKRIGTVLQQDREIATGAGHHSVVNIPGTDEWYIVYHRRPLSETSPHHRVTCIDRMHFDETGHILPVKITMHGVTPRLISDFKK